MSDKRKRVKKSNAATYRKETDARPCSSTDMMGIPDDPDAKTIEVPIPQGDIVSFDGHEFIADYPSGAKEEDKWSDVPYMPGQEVRYPSTSKMTDIKTEVFDLGNEDDRLRYDRLFTEIAQLKRVSFKDFFQAPDPGKVNFRLCVIHGKRMYRKLLLVRNDKPSKTTRP